MSGWECNSTGGTVHDEMDCPGWEVCCEPGSDTGTGGDCTDNHEIQFDWSDATITDPMTSAESGSIPGMWYIYTSEADSGTAVEGFNLPCDDTWYMWGRAWVPWSYGDPYNTLTITGGESEGEAMNDHPALGTIVFTNDPDYTPWGRPGVRALSSSSLGAQCDAPVVALGSLHAGHARKPEP